MINNRRDTVQFVKLLDEMQNTKKMKHEKRKKGNMKKSKRNRVSSFNIYIIVFAFLLSTVEVGRWKKLS